MKKTIWILNHYAADMFLDHGGRHYAFAKYLMRAGYDVRIFCACTVHNSDTSLIQDGALYREDSCDGIPFVFVRARNYRGNGKQRILNMLDFYRRIFSVARHFEKPDVILGSSVHPLTCVAAIRLSRRYHCQNIVEIRDLWPESIVAYGIRKKSHPAVLALYRLEKWLYAKADAIVFTMEGGRDYIVEKGWDKQIHGGPVDLDMVHHINNGVDLEVFDDNRSRYFLPDPDLDDPDAFKVVYTGSIRKANIVDCYADVALALKKRGLDRVRILIWGRGDGLEALQSKICQYGLSNIKYKGCVSKSEVPSLLCRADLTTFLSEKTPLIRYGFSLNKSFEYAAAGKPMLVNVVGRYSLIGEYGCGMQTDGFDAKRMAEEIERCARLSRDDYEALCEKSKAAARDYDYKRLTDRLIRIIEDKT